MFPLATAAFAPASVAGARASVAVSSANTASASANTANRGAFVADRSANTPFAHPIVADATATAAAARANMTGARAFPVPHMTKPYASERAAALIHQALDALKGGDENGVALKTITPELGKVMEQEGAAAVAMTFDAIYRETEAEAKLHGPRSEAAQRLPLIQLLLTAGSKSVSRNRRQKGDKTSATKSAAMQRLEELTAAEILDAPPANKPVIAIPAEESSSGRERLLIRIGVRRYAWVGSFEQGNRGATTVQLMPDGHLFVAARGAGYIVDLKSRTLIEKIGDDVMTVSRDDSGSLFIVNHNYKTAECFGPSGRVGCGS